ncbi:predicted protein [Chaetoceros tenuissimus]|uniref:Uncharacterized protein n=1 Tax=Chaetoceros tenuissimus TaxID=426638 RepID=A0AAD3CDH7_9STRA|nr:predicted protein [Chaetoceros tenuissimus]
MLELALGSEAATRNAGYLAETSPSKAHVNVEGALVVAVLYFIFIVVGAVAVGKFIKEIDGGIFINTE